MAVSINELKSGLTILIDGQIYMVLEYHHVKPGKGAAFVRTRLRNLRNGATVEKTFRGNEKIEEAFIDERKLEYLYHSDNLYHFMDQQNFEEVGILKDNLGSNSKFLKDNLEVTARSYKGEVISIELPTFITFKVKHAEPGAKGDTAKAAYKSATLQTGATVQVPLFIQEGDLIKIDTRSGQYVERVG